MDILWGLIAALFLVALNGFFVAAEFAMVKVRITQLDARIAQGSKLAVYARHCIENLDPYLSATQLGITVASLGLGWIGEPVVHSLIFPLISWMGVDIPAEAIATALGFAIISFLHIVAGEVAPKTLAISKPEAVTMAVALPMRFFFYLFYPALKVLNASSNLLLRLVRVEPVKEHSMAMSPEELHQITVESTEGGTIPENQGALLRKVFTFSDRVTHEIMVPRNRIAAININEPVNQVLDQVFSTVTPAQGKRPRAHTRYLLYKDSLDNVIGILHLKDLMRAQRVNPEILFRKIARPAHFVPETMPAQRLLREFQRLRTHMVVVVDEYGGVAGIVTLEDTLEELVGEIQDEFDSDERPPVEEIEGGYSVDGAFLLEDLTDLLKVEEVESESATISGYLMERLGRIPQTGDAVFLGPWIVQATAMDQRRIERVSVLLREASSVETDPLAVAPVAASSEGAPE
jgi:CBS domain containing-hemolysin-like protein